MIRKYEIKRYINYFIKEYQKELEKIKGKDLSDKKKDELKTEIFESVIVKLFLCILRRHFALDKEDIEKIFLPVFLACVKKRSITNIIETLRRNDIEAYSINTEFSKLNNYDPEILKPYIDCCRMVSIGIGKHFGLTLRNLIIGIDINAIPYYGDHSSFEVMGNERKAGTNWAFKYLTCSIVVEGIRFVVESLPLTQISLIPHEVEKLIRSAKKLGNIRLILLDRGFNGTEYQDVINELSSKFVMPMIENEKIERIVANEKPEFKQIKYTYYENRAVEYRRNVYVIITDKETDGKKHLFITNIRCNNKAHLKLLVETYRKRWSIETLFREKNKFCAFTCTPSFTVRNIFQQVSYLFQDALVLVNFILLNEQRRLERWEEMTNAEELYEILYAFTMKLKKKFWLIVISFHFIDDLIEIFRDRLRLLYPIPT